MDLKTKKKISLFGILAFFFILFAASVYIYFQGGKGKEGFFISFLPVVAIWIVPLYYFGKGKKETRQKHAFLQILIVAIGWLAFFLWHVPQTSFFLITDSTTSFLWIWESAASWFFVGLMFVIGNYYTDEIAEKFKRKNTDDSKQNE